MRFKWSDDENKASTRNKKMVSFRRSVLWIIGGTAASQMVAIAFSPILTRLYSPIDFGNLAVFTALVSILQVIATLRYDQAIPIPRSQKSAAALVAISILSVIGISLIFQLVVLAILQVGFPFHGGRLPKEFFLLLPFGLGICGLYQVFAAWHSRQHSFSTIGKANMLRSLGQTLVQIGLGVGHLAGGLVYGYIGGQLVSTLFLIKTIPIRGFNLARIRYAARKYVKFPQYTLWGSLVNVSGLQLPTLLISAMFSSETAGYYNLAMRVLGLPVSLIAQSFGQVLYPIASRTEGDSLQKKYVKAVFLTLAVSSIVIFGGLLVEGPFLFRLVFGDTWEISGLYARILTIWLAASFVSSPLSTIALVKGKQKRALFMTLYETALRVASIWAGALLGSDLIALTLFSVSGAFICTVYICWVLRLAGLSLISLLKEISRPLFLGGSIVLLCFSFTFIFQPTVHFPVTCIFLAIYSFLVVVPMYRRMIR